MATYKLKSKGKEKVVLEFVFDGNLQSNSRGPLINELIKYLLYERQQIPLPFDNIKKELSRALDEDTQQVPGVHVQNGRKPSKKNGFNKLELKRATKTINNLDEIFSHLVQVFTSCPEIQEIMLIFGGTSVSPKESYHINMPAINPDTDGMLTKVIVKSLMKQLIVQDMLKNSKSMRITNLIVLVLAPRNCGIQGFLPKPAFKPPGRGVQYMLDLVCKHTCTNKLNEHDLSKDDFDIEISGIEPFEASYLDVGERDGPEDKVLEDFVYVHDTLTTSHPPRSSSQEMMVDMTHKGEKVKNVLEDFIWFQAPHIVKGFKDKSSRRITSADGTS